MKKVRTAAKQMVQKIDIQVASVVIMIILISSVMSYVYDGFLSAYNIKAMLMSYVPEGIIALGLTLVIISGGIDLSVAGVMPFTAIIYCLMIKNGINIWLGMLFVLIIAAGIGACNNYLRNLLNVHPFIVTMAMQLILKGFNLVVTGSGSISGLPEEFMQIAEIRILGIKLPLVVLLILAIIWTVLLAKNRFFRKVYFVGGNAKAADLCGINVNRTMYFVFMQSAVLAAIAGLMAVLNFQAANYSYGLNLDTRAITCVVVGGTSMTRGGVGSVGGTIIGLIFIALVYNAFLLSGINTYFQDVVTGVFLVGAVLLGQRVKRK
ncbi:ABC transporter permease [Anaerolentibacter hominis]|uniref:ABC transporter permease n=1 Tax=Anaerolentibacter hominis TaxID=3079009 RepID=UPI0031B80311